MIMFATMPTPPPPHLPPTPRTTDGRLDPIALAWYRYRIEAGHYDSSEVLLSIADYVLASDHHDDDPPR
jgi:hypothetical protein